ncbi:sodium:solute symporter family protein [Flavilitoribacter nigricans]|uniref:Sodium:solute symporter n=1 Tax=Flavilitoribacter nigricans (strain ATCC 23147 / DSM 23189 / NBRC 102662 / NCIMB 1420 / SS-2) TaxID=1122177 RepID=A0A2D0N6P9_FLAN2|nr:sodium:solute symporter family protein [Flavilitoribacter nigricans]PHN04212.1 sodium:solute symporter [Flavilitoribacter nigricans DSM 23189 = NBRC 102662]
MLLTFIVVYLLFTLAIGWWASRKVKTTRDFVIAGQNLPLLLAGSALFATWFGSETIMGAPSEFVEHGLIGVVEDPFGAALCLILVGLFFARPLYRMNIITFNDFFRLRFSRRTELITSIIIVPSYFGWIAAQLVAMAIVLNVIAGVSVFTGIAICTVVVLFYTYIGGMWAVSITDFVQTFMILAGLLFLAFQLSGQLGGVQTVLAQMPDDFFHFLPEGDLESILAYVAAWITIGLGSIPQQDVFQRVMAAKSEKTAVRASYLGGFMYLSIGLIPLFIGVCSKLLYPELQEGDAQMVIPQMVLQHGNMLLQILFFGALLSAILSTTSGAILAPATVIGENIIRPNFKDMDDARLLQIMRLAVVGVAVCSAFMATLKTNIYDLVAQSSTLSLVSLFVPLTMGLYWKRASDMGAILSIVLGMVAWIIAEMAGGPIPPILVGGIASFAGMLIGSLGWPGDGADKYREILKLRQQKQ